MLHVESPASAVPHLEFTHSYFSRLEPSVSQPPEPARCPCWAPRAPASPRPAAGSEQHAHATGAQLCTAPCKGRNSTGQPSTVTFSRVALCREWVSEKQESNPAEPKVLYRSGGCDTGLRALCRQHHALCCLFASLLPWQHRDSHWARRTPREKGARASCGAASGEPRGQRHPGIGAQGGHGPAACGICHHCSGSQHGNQLGDLRTSQGRFPCCIRCSKRFGGGIEEREKEPPVRGPLRLRLARLRVYPSGAGRPPRPRSGRGKASPLTATSALPQPQRKDSSGTVPS